MPFNGSGTFSRVYNWVTDKNNSINITASRMDTEDTGFATGLTNCICKDGQSTPTANLPMGGFAHTGVALATLATQYPRVDQVQSSAFNWIAGGGTADAITGTYAPALTSLTDGLVLKFRATAANATATPTFAPNGLTAHTITKKGGAALLPGDIAAALAEYEIVYNLANTRWELMNPTVLPGTPWVVAGGTADAITATYSPAILALTDGLIVAFRAGAANATTTPTFAPNGLTAHTITLSGGSALAAGNIAAALAEYFVRYNLANTRWELMNPTVVAAATGALVLLATVNASTASSVAFSSTYITNAYNKYVIEFDSLYGSAASVDLLLTVSTNNGSGYLSANYFAAGQHQGADTATISGADTGSSSSINLSFAGGNGITSNSTSTAHGTIKFSNPLATAVCQFIFDWVGFNTSTFVHYLGWGYNTGTTAINNIKIAASSGTVTGNFHLYGVSGT